MNMVSEIVRGHSPTAREGAAENAPQFVAPIFSDEVAHVVASPERIRAWLSIAAPGDQLLYATRASSLGNAPGAVLMRTLASKCLVHLKQRRVGRSLVHNYIAERSSKALAVPAARPKLSAKLDMIGDDEVGLVNALMEQLNRAARFRLPCPTDAQMARKAGMPVEFVPPLMQVMVSSGLIRVHSAPAPTLRTVTIVNSNETTGVAA